MLGHRPAARPTTRLEILAAGLTLALGLASALGFLGRWHPVLDLLGCFRLQYALLLVLPVLLFLVRRRWMWLAVGAAILAVDGGLVAEPWLRSAPRVDRPVGTLRLLRINLVDRGVDPAAIEAYIRESRPDVLVLSLCSGPWMERLHSLLEGPWGGAWHRVRTGYATTIISRYPLTWAPGEKRTDPVVLAFPGAPLRVVGMHPPRPIHAAGWRRNADDLASVAKSVGRDPVGTIVVGDLNATPWSHAFRRLLDETGLVDSRRGFGNHATWPAGLATPVVGIPIDHALVSRDIGVLERTVGPDVGDPHLPVLIVLEIGER